MHSTRLVNLMMAALSVTAVTGVAWLDNQNVGAGQLAVRADDEIISIGPNLDADTTSEAPAAEPTTSEEKTNDTPTTSEAPPETTSDTPTTSDEPTPTPTTSDDPTPTPTTSDDTTPTTTRGTTPTTPVPTTTTPPPNGPSSSGPTPTSSSGGNGGDDDDTTEVPHTTPPPTTSTFITVITSTDAAGQTHVSSSSSVIVSTPSPVPVTNDDKETGMSPAIKRTIIGVCVGVGGAIVLAAAGVLFWRLRSKKRSLEENEELVSYGDGFGGPGTAEKSEPSGSTAGRSPFQSTLESYHAPTQTNAASNF
ncbi:hypothetical protein Daesc_001504 [Daldinia eschscholtzii]|uniref:Mid2 domain-containing protein n=1 Tax=Daldinia eschscholtzii TaxID=292717 RepID=A0AAX6MVM3_9PEZI